MIKKSTLFILVVGIILLIPSTADAHQPRLTSDMIKGVVSNPEISKAYYDELTGNPRTYRISTNNEFNLYLNILVPKNTNPDGRYSAVIYMVGKTARSTIDKIDVNSTPWKEFYEEYGNDYYYQGPEYRRKLPPGDYEIVVSGNNNLGKYTLAIGEIEAFPLKEGLNALLTVPKLKKSFFGESPATFLFSKFGGVEFIVIVLLGFLFGFVYRLIHKKLSKISPAVKKGKNIGKSDRLLRALIAILCLAFGLYSWSIILFFFAGFCFFEAIFSWCGLYAIMQKNTCPIS